MVRGVIVAFKKNQSRWPHVRPSRGLHFLLRADCRSAGSTDNSEIAATGREWGTLLSPRHIEKAAEERSQRHKGNTDPEVYRPCAHPLPDKAVSLTALSFLPLAYFI